MRNLHQLFDWQYIGEIIGLLRIYKLYVSNYNVQQSVLFLQKFVTMGATFEGGTGVSFETRKEKLFLFCLFLSCVTL